MSFRLVVFRIHNISLKDPENLFSILSSFVSRELILHSRFINSDSPTRPKCERDRGCPAELSASVETV